MDVASLSEEEQDRVAVIFGSGIGGILTFQQQAINYHENGVRRISPFFIPMLIPDIASGQISISSFSR